MEVARTDRCLFLARDPKTGMVDGALGIHVDDCVAAGSKRFEEQVLEKLGKLPGDGGGQKVEKNCQ